MCLRNRRLRRELTSVVPVAVSSTGRPDLLGTVSLVPESASLLSGRGQTAVDTVLVLVVADPVDLGIVLDDRACGVHEDDLVPLVLSICSDPVAVQNLEVLVSLLGPLFGDALEGFADDELLLSLPLGPPSGLDLSLLEGTLPDLCPDEDVSLLGLVAEGPCPVEPGGLLDAEEVLFFPPLDLPLLVEGFHIGLGTVRPGLGDVLVHALSLRNFLLGRFICHFNHLFGFALAGTFPRNTYAP